MNLGIELVTNNGFTGGLTGWDTSVDTRWLADPLYPDEVYWSGNDMEMDANPDTLSQSIAIAAGKSYKVAFDVTRYFAGDGSTVKAYLGGTLVAEITSTGTKEYTVLAGETDSLIKFIVSFDQWPSVGLDNVSVCEVLSDTADTGGGGGGGGRCRVIVLGDDRDSRKRKKRHDNDPYFNAIYGGKKR
jgi:hypothetical protein